jgi:hypothetical protein
VKRYPFARLLTRCRLVLLCTLAAASVGAQDETALEIRGTVLEIGPGTGLAGAKVTVYQFDQNRDRKVFDTATTGQRGEFTFHPAQLGDYYVEASKPEYVGPGAPYYDSPQPLAQLANPYAQTTGILLTLSREHRSEDLRFALMRLGELSGRLADEDGKPAPKLALRLVADLSNVPPALWPSSPRMTPGVVSGADGSFRVTKLPPGDYLVQIAGTAASRAPSQTFSESDLNSVDQGVEPLYWPGVPDQASAARVTVSPGGSATLREMIVRKEPLYKALFSVRGCEPKEPLQFSAVDPSQPAELQSLRFFLNGNKLSCGDFLVPGFRPGSYEFDITTQGSAARVTVQITGSNVTVPVNLTPNGDLTGRVIAPPGMELGKLRIGSGQIRPTNGPSPAAVDSEGNFTLRDVTFLPTQIGVGGLNKPYYVQEIRVNGVATPPDVLVPISPGARLEIVVDNQPATLAVSVTDWDPPVGQVMVYIAKEPGSQLLKGQTLASGNPQATLSALVPGDYRVMAVRSVLLADGESPQGLISRLWNRAEKITLGRGEAKSISVKLIDPSR